MTNKKKILIVDDESIILNSFRKDFEYEGYHVKTVENPLEAIELLKKEFFNLLLTDLSMPEVDGVTVLQEAKKADPAICTIILTGAGDLSSAISALRLGADDYLLKPCDSEELLLRVERCLEKQELVQKLKLYEKFLSICSYCKKVRDDSIVGPGKGQWISIESYMQNKGGVDLSHGICPTCYDKVMLDYKDE